MKRPFLAGFKRPLTPSTGLIENSIGYNFGFPDGTSTWLISQTATPPTYTGQDIQAPSAITAAASGKVAAVGTRGGQSWLQVWQTGDPWTLDFTYNTPGQGLGPGALSSHAEADTVLINFPRRTFTDGSAKTRCGATVEVGTGTVVELDNDWKSTNTANNDNHSGRLFMQDDAPSDVMISGLSRTIRTSGFSWPYHLQGVSATWEDDAKKGLRGPTIGWNADTIFCSHFGGIDITSTRNDVLIQRTIAGQPIAFSGARAYVYEFHTRAGTEFNSAAEFRFRFQSNGLPPLETAWLARTATAADIKAAIIGVFGENTEGVVSNVVVNAFGDPPALAHDSSLLERNLSIQFATQTAASLGFGLIPPQYVSRPLTNVVLQVRNTADPYSGGFGAYDTSDGSVIWSRNFGTRPDSSIAVNAAGWLQGDLLYLYGELVVNELP